ncbi:hypothetical protein C8R47DRAFT_189676 [Mycena vitilis]|nr:hypothetical protein C8R47DRAFT_189676 [Mycena vitilis]
MPTHTSPPNLVGYTLLAASTAKDIAAITELPFLGPAATLTAAILSSMESMKAFKDECTRILDSVHEILCVIVTFYSACPESLSMLTYEMAKFAETLQKMLTFVSSQLRMSKLKQLLRKFDSAQQLDVCKSEFKGLLETFRTQTSVAVMGKISLDQQDLEKRHAELLGLLEASPELTVSERSSLTGTMSMFGSSSGSFSMMPVAPQIFHGRESELVHILEILQQNAPRIAILGAGGIGKTSLALVALHDVHVATAYPHRFFLQCQSASTRSDLISGLAAHLGIERSSDVLGGIVAHLSAKPSLLMLDNFETPWEFPGSQSEVDDLLSHLSGISSLAILITMRGVERPANIRWSHPFLPPLQPLTDSAALQTFFDIADDYHDEVHVHELLQLTGNLPLAVSLIAHVADHEGCPVTLSRWQGERTHLLSDGYDKISSLDISIMLSLSSPRMNQGAQELLSILSMLPDGLSDGELIQSQIPIPSIMAMKAVLLRTALAYTGSNHRVTVLFPVREYVMRTFPPAEPSKLALRLHFRRFLGVWDRNVRGDGAASQIRANYGNLNSVFEDALRSDYTDTLENLESVIILTRFSHISGRQSSRLMEQVSEQIGNWEHDGIFGRYLVEKFKSALLVPIEDPDRYIQAGNAYFKDKTEIEKGRWYNALGHFFGHRNEMKKALNYHHLALALVETVGVPNFEEMATLRGLAEILSRIGQYAPAQANAEKGQQYAELLGDTLAQAQCVGISARCCYSLGDFSEALRLVQKAQELWASCGIIDPSTLLDEGEIHNLKTEYAECREINVQLMGKPSMHQAPSWFTAIASLNVAFVDLQIQGDPNIIRQNLESAQTQFRALHYVRGLAICSMGFAHLQLFEGDPQSANCAFEQSFRQLQHIAPEDAGYCLEKLADICSQTGDVAASLRWSGLYLASSVLQKSQLETLKALRCIGDILGSEGEEESALRMYRAALAGFTRMDVHRYRADCMVRMADIHGGRGDTEQVIELLSKARPLFERSSQGTNLQSVDTKLSKLLVR